MHQSVLNFIAENLRPNEVYKRNILEVGSANVNGSVRPFIENMKPALYVGLDLQLDRGVDVVCPVEDYVNVTDRPSFDVVVSCEMLEHAQQWQDAVKAMCSMSKETLILTCRGPGFHRHNAPDHWRFRPDDLHRAVAACGMVVTHCGFDPQASGVFIKAIRPGFIPVMREPGDV